MVCDPWPEQVYQWHREGFDLPLGAELLAEGDSFPVQAFRYNGAAFALQFHPDVTHAMMCRWTTRGHERMLLPNAKPRVAHFADRAVYDPAGRAWLAAFLNHWLVERVINHRFICRRPREGTRGSRCGIHIPEVVLTGARVRGGDSIVSCGWWSRGGSNP